MTGENRVMKFVLSLMAVACCFVGCSKQEPHGKSSPSEDGKTYLEIGDLGDNCSTFRVDGKEWLMPIYASAKIEPGRHIISCVGSGDFEINIERGTVLRLDKRN